MWGFVGQIPQILRRKTLHAPLPSLTPPKATWASQLKDKSFLAVLILLNPLRGLALSTTPSLKPCPPSAPMDSFIPSSPPSLFVLFPT